MVIRGASHDVVVVTAPLKAIQLLRLKCEAYTTMNDVDEDTDAERRLNDRMANNGGGIPPQQHLLAPAALYLTAIIE